MIMRSLRAASVLALLAWSQWPADVSAQGERLRDMDRRSWTPADGTPIAINHLAQDHDGSLWIGSAPPLSLYRFDGETFRPFQSPPGEPALPQRHVTSLLVTKAGAVWVAFRNAGLARVAGSRVTVYDSVDSKPIETVRYMREAPDGVVWAIDSRQGLIRLGSDGTWRMDSAPTSSPISAMFVDSSNTLWLAQDGFLHRRTLPQTSYLRTEVRTEVVTGFTETPNREIWISEQHAAAATGRIQQIDQGGRLIRTLPDIVSESGAMLAMPDGSLIVASFVAGLRRMSAFELSSPPPVRDESEADSFGPADGLSSRWPRALLVDAHRNIWIGSQFGLDRLRPRQLPRSLPSQPGATWGTCSTADGDTMITNSLGTLYSVAQGTPTRLPYGIPAAVRSFACASVDRFWFVDPRGEIWSSVAGRETRLPPIEGLRQREFVKMVRASDGTLYVSAVGTSDYAGSVWRYRNDRWTQLHHGGAPNPGGHAYVDRRDRLWIGTTDGRTIVHDESSSRMLPSGEPGLGNIHAFHETSHGLLAAGSNGLAVMRDSAFEMLSYEEPSLVRGVRGIIESSNGDVWLNSANGFAQLTAGEIGAAIANAAYPMKVRLVREGDFIPNFGAHSLRVPFWDTVARDAHGSLWFSVLNARRSEIVRFDPANSHTMNWIPKLTIRSIEVDGQPLANDRTIKPAARTIRFQFFGVSLTSPESVVYRYRLDGFDDAWQESGRRTEARYTTLPAGTYEFRVIASSSDGLWTDPVSTGTFVVSPKFHQTWWFAVTIVAALVLVAGAVHRIRVRQISREMRLRFDERLAERTRVARELHDTLLQTLHGSKLVADRALRDTTDQGRLVRALEQLSTWLGQAAAEGRAALQSLRAVTVENNDLAAALRRALDECRQDSGAEAALSVQGEPRAFHPVVRDEIFRIGYEAIRNACVHSRASRIDVVLDYSHDLTLRVSDNGIGISAAVVETGKDGHFGLRGMRERAERISAAFTLESNPGNGTTVALVVPGPIAFR
jgi:signal transduction histidine kinase/ligand-binding sensor domain-containing protein